MSKKTRGGAPPDRSRSGKGRPGARSRPPERRETPAADPRRAHGNRAVRDVFRPAAPVGRADDAAEAEADGVAERAVRGAPGPGPAPGPALGAEPESASSSRPLDPRTRAFFETRLGASLGGVRIHTGPRAEDAARALGARAYTLDRDIVFGEGEYRPGTEAGSRLLAHELAHAAFHPAGTIRRRTYETRGADLDRADVVSLAGTSYWEQRTLQSFDSALHSRFSDPEERDAVLSAFWAGNPPTSVTAATTTILRVPSRSGPAPAGTPGGGAGGTTQLQELIYRVTITPPTPPSTKPTLAFEFVALDAPAQVPAAPASYQAQYRALTSQDFPGGHPAYFAAHPAEHRALFHFLDGIPSGFDRVVITSTPASGSGGAAHQSAIHVRNDPASGVELRWLSQSALPAPATLPADYHQRDGVDLELDDLRAPSVAAPDRLGTISLPPNLPADERTAAKYAVWQYFANGARDTEVDAIVPVGSGSRTVLYTLIFGANNDVTVTRVGEAGTGPGQVDPDRIDVTRVRGFPTGSARTVSGLRTWWAARYPQGGTLTPTPAAPAQGQPATPAPTVTTLIAEMNQLITTGVASRSWFDQNYGIEVLVSGALTTRLQNVHGVPGPPAAPTDPPDLSSDTVNPTSTDLRMLELSLQTLSSHELALLRDAKVGRKTGPIEPAPGGGFQQGSPDQYGLTLRTGTGSARQVTVLYFQSLYDNNDRLFRGSTVANVLPNLTMRFLHELGHAAADSTSVETAFQAWIAANPQTSPTWYAASNPGRELFPEAFALFHTDPRFLCQSAPLLYAWFHELATTGTPPGGSASLTPPTSCP